MKTILISLFFILPFTSNAQRWFQLQPQADWNSLSGASVILNKPDVGAKLDTASSTFSGSFSQVGTATTTFTVTIGRTLSNSTYKVDVTPTAALSAALFYVSTKTTTTFQVIFLAGLTGTVTFDWTIFRQ